jgi:hypothetical protein
MALVIARLERAISRIALAISEFPLRPRRAIILRHPKAHQINNRQKSNKNSLTTQFKSSKEYKTTKYLKTNHANPKSPKITIQIQNRLYNPCNPSLNLTAALQILIDQFSY